MASRTPLRAMMFRRPIARACAPTCTFATTSLRAANGKDTLSKKEAMMDKDAINTSSNEYAKTGGGDAGAAHTSKAFDPTDTSPEGQHEGTQQEAGESNPIEVSPGNHSTNNVGPEQVRESSQKEGGAGSRRSASGSQARAEKGSGSGKK